MSLYFVFDLRLPPHTCSLGAWITNFTIEGFGKLWCHTCPYLICVLSTTIGAVSWISGLSCCSIVKQCISDLLYPYKNVAPWVGAQGKNYRKGVDHKRTSAALCLTTVALLMGSEFILSLILCVSFLLQSVGSLCQMSGRWLLIVTRKWNKFVGLWSFEFSLTAFKTASLFTLAKEARTKSPAWWGAYHLGLTD